MNHLSRKLYNAISSPMLSYDKVSSSFHPSSSSIKILTDKGLVKTVGSCLRKEYYRITDTSYSNDSKPDWEISSYLGDRMHELIADLLDKYGFSMKLQKIATEHPFFYQKHNISGRCDMLLWDLEEQAPIGLEIKSVGEYKASKVITSPDPEHVMQSMIYLDYYRNHIPKNQLYPKKWYIWYLSRTENWVIKSKKHGSPLQNMWDYCVELSPAGCPIINSNEGREVWTNYTLDAIYTRFNDLKKHLVDGVIPDRDYILEYPEEKILGMYKLGLLEKKGDIELIERWIKKGSIPGALRVEMGDFECKMCPWKDSCWGSEVNIMTEPSKFNFPLVKNETKQEDKLLL